MCGHPRPSDYEVPAGYAIPQVELDRIAAEQEAERLAREVIIYYFIFRITATCDSLCCVVLTGVSKGCV